MTNKHRREISAVIQMLSEASYWQKQLEHRTESLEQDRDEWRHIANLFALAETRFDHREAFDRWTEDTHQQGEQQ